MKRIALISTLTVFLPSAAHAHMGHVGELAGHSHWVGVAAVLGAAAIAALAAKARKRAERSEDGAAEEEAEEQPEGGSA